jgi:hypothetical protein
MDYSPCINSQAASVERVARAEAATVVLSSKLFFARYFSFLFG